MSPTITVVSIFFFVRPQNVCVVDTFYRTTKSTAPASGIISELLQRVPPFVYSIFNVRYKTGRNYRVPPFNFFSALCEFFFSKIFNFSRVPPSDFLIFCNRKYVNESQRVPRFHFSALCDVFEVFFKNFFQKKFSKKFSKIFLFPVKKSDFPVISSMKGTLWVSRKCFQSFS